MYLISYQILKGIQNSFHFTLRNSCCSNYHMVNGTYTGFININDQFFFFNVRTLQRIYSFFKICLACSLGYFGSNCGVPCDYPAYEQFCLLSCNCNQSECDHRYGCKIDGKSSFFGNVYHNTHRLCFCWQYII